VRKDARGIAQWHDRTHLTNSIEATQPRGISVLVKVDKEGVFVYDMEVYSLCVVFALQTCARYEISERVTVARTSWLATKMDSKSIVADLHI
jgi:hypothetical protein